MKKEFLEQRSDFRPTVVPISKEKPKSSLSMLIEASKQNRLTNIPRSLDHVSPSDMLQTSSREFESFSCNDLLKISYDYGRSLKSVYIPSYENLKVYAAEEDGSADFELPEFSRDTEVLSMGISRFVVLDRTTNSQYMQVKFQSLVGIELHAGEGQNADMGQFQSERQDSRDEPDSIASSFDESSVGRDRLRTLSAPIDTSPPSPSPSTPSLPRVKVGKWVTPSSPIFDKSITVAGNRDSNSSPLTASPNYRTSMFRIYCRKPSDTMWEPVRDIEISNQKLASLQYHGGMYEMVKPMARSHVEPTGGLTSKEQKYNTANSFGRDEVIEFSVSSPPAVTHSAQVMLESTGSNIASATRYKSFFATVPNQDLGLSPSLAPRDCSRLVLTSFSSSSFSDSDDELGSSRENSVDMGDRWSVDDKDTDTQLMQDIERNTNKPITRVGRYIGRVIDELDIAGSMDTEGDWIGRSDSQDGFFGNLDTTPRSSASSPDKSMRYSEGEESAVKDSKVFGARSRKPSRIPTASRPPLEELEAASRVRALRLTEAATGRRTAMVESPLVEAAQRGIASLVSNDGDGDDGSKKVVRTQGDEEDNEDNDEAKNIFRDAGSPALGNALVMNLDTGEITTMSNLENDGETLFTADMLFG